MESIRWLVELGQRAGMRRLILDESFTTGIIEPNDVDCALWIPDSDDVDVQALLELRAGLPFIDVTILRTRNRFDMFAKDLFSSDRLGRAKGVIEVTL